MYDKSFPMEFLFIDIMNCLAFVNKITVKI